MNSDNLEWFLLRFTLPKGPSRIRLSTWRKLKKCGSIDVAQSTWLLPVSELNLIAFSELAQDILEQNGDTYIMKASFMPTAYPKIFLRCLTRREMRNIKNFWNNVRTSLESLTEKWKRKPYVCRGRGEQT